jgi:hypothetical protein
MFVHEVLNCTGERRFQCAGRGRGQYLQVENENSLIAVVPLGKIWCPVIVVVRILEEARNSVR